MQIHIGGDSLNSTDKAIAGVVQSSTTLPLLSSPLDTSWTSKLKSPNGSNAISFYTNSTSTSWIELLSMHSRSPRSIALAICIIGLAIVVCLYCMMVCNRPAFCCCCVRHCFHKRVNDYDYASTQTTSEDAHQNENIERRRLLLSMPQPDSIRRTTIKQAIINKYKVRKNDREEVERLWIQN